MVIFFKYKKIKRPDKTEVKSPSIPISLEGKNNFDTLGLLDSGADISAIPKDVAEILGLDLKGKKSSAFGIGGKVNAIDTKMRLIIQKGHEKYNFLVPVKVILDDYAFGVILGRVGFFDKFIISFDQLKEKVSLKRKIRN